MQNKINPPVQDFTFTVPPEGTSQGEPHFIASGSEASISQTSIIPPQTPTDVPTPRPREQTLEEEPVVRDYQKEVSNVGTL